MRGNHTTFIHPFSILLAILVALPLCRASAENSNTSADVLFDRANEAYDRGDYAEARGNYSELFNRGYYTVETLYNAANAAFRSGSAGEAVLLYRQAWYLNPRDADILANMQLAQQRTGALQPAASLIDRMAGEFSSREWASLLSISYWLSLALFTVMLLLPSTRRFLKPAATATCLAAAVGFCGWLYWYHWQTEGEAVVTEAKQTALYEPRERATPFFEVPEGSIVFLEESFDSWVKIRAGKNTGWLLKTAVSPVYPWINAEIE